ncbi:MAG: PPC domain-containing DNA-binding protein [Prochlorothrix sp.]|nr:PPC domain-containing DNA-binding protein [Prochlorothrix sp.]
MKVYALRLKPNEDLKQGLKQFAAEKNLLAGCVLTTVGSLHQASLRFANCTVPKVLRRKFEILSLSGTLSIYGVNLRLAVADKTGQTLGGQVEPGCLVYTTAEIVVAELPDYTFQREIDRSTGYQELVVRSLGREFPRPRRTDRRSLRCNGINVPPDFND